MFVFNNRPIYRCTKFMIVFYENCEETVLSWFNNWSFSFKVCLTTAAVTVCKYQIINTHILSRPNQLKLSSSCIIGSIFLKAEILKWQFYHNDWNNLVPWSPGWMIICFIVGWVHHWFDFAMKTSFEARMRRLVPKLT